MKPQNYRIMTSKSAVNGVLWRCLPIRQVKHKTYILIVAYFCHFGKEIRKIHQNFLLPFWRVVPKKQRNFFKIFPNFACDNLPAKFILTTSPHDAIRDLNPRPLVFNLSLWRFTWKDLKYSFDISIYEYGIPLDLN